MGLNLDCVRGNGDRTKLVTLFIWAETDLKVFMDWNHIENSKHRQGLNLMFNPKP